MITAYQVSLLVLLWAHWGEAIDATSYSSYSQGGGDGGGYSHGGGGGFNRGAAAAAARDFPPAAPHFHAPPPPPPHYHVPLPAAPGARAAAPPAGYPQPPAGFPAQGFPVHVPPPPPPHAGFPASVRHHPHAPAFHDFPTHPHAYSAPPQGSESDGEGATSYQGGSSYSEQERESGGGYRGEGREIGGGGGGGQARQGSAEEEPQLSDNSRSGQHKATSFQSFVLHSYHPLKLSRADHDKQDY